jgi:hypothetical protein
MHPPARPQKDEDQPAGKGIEWSMNGIRLGGWPIRMSPKAAERAAHGGRDAPVGEERVACTNWRCARAY